MLLFDDFKAVKSKEGDEILIFRNRDLFCIYYYEKDTWERHRSTMFNSHNYFLGNCCDIGLEEIKKATKGKVPKKQEDLLKLCNITTLYQEDLKYLLTEEYYKYLHNDLLISSEMSFEEKRNFKIENYGYPYSIEDIVDVFLSQTPALSKAKAYYQLKEVLDDAKDNNLSVIETTRKLRQLYLETFNQDLFNSLIVNDGENSRSDSMLMPAKILKNYKAAEIETIIDSNYYCISFDETLPYCSSDYVAPFLIKHYDNNLDANVFVKNCEIKYEDNFSYITNCVNYFSLNSFHKIIKDIRQTKEDILNDNETEYTIIINNLNSELDKRLIVDFYNRLLYRLEFMERVSKEKGFNLIEWLCLYI